MTRVSQIVLAAVAAGAVLLPINAAQSQYYGAPAPAPLYPYAAQPGQPYAIQVAPNTYVIRRPGRTRSHSAARSSRHGHVIVRAEPQTRSFDGPSRRNDRAMIEELRNRRGVKHQVINTTRIVREKPVVIETQRIVDDPPRVIERYVHEDAPPRQRRGKQAATAEVEDHAAAKRPAGDGNKKRVIEADAEVTILGPDRMSIRLFRKGHRGANARASAD